MRLRKLEEKDAQGMLEWMHDVDIQKNFCADFKNKTLKNVLEFIRQANVEFVDNQDVHFAIVSDDNDEYMGTISLKKIDINASNAEYAICLRKKAQHQGMAKQATKELLRIAFEEWKLKRVYLNVLAENQVAIKLYEKCGFVYEGEFRKHLFIRGEYKSLKWYAMLQDDYLSKYK